MTSNIGPTVGGVATLDIRAAWSDLSEDEKLLTYRSFSPQDAEDLFLSLKSNDQAELLALLSEPEQRAVLRLLPPDDLTDLIQEKATVHKDRILSLLDYASQKEVRVLLAYKEDEAGGLMSPRFPRVRPDMKVEDAIAYVRRQAQQVESMRYIYVLDNHQKLLGVISLRHLFASPSDKIVSNVMRNEMVTALASQSQEEIKDLFIHSGLQNIPVLDADGHMRGVITLDDIVDVVEEAATEDIQRMGAVEVLDEPYLKIGYFAMVRKRALWLSVLFVGEMMTTTAMGHFTSDIEKAVVLSVFIPLIISSGGNSGSQASTLVVRALALKEIYLRDWWRVFFREIVMGLGLGVILAVIGFTRIYLFPLQIHLTQSQVLLIPSIVAISLVGIVMWGSLCGAMLPFVLKKLKLDPATASAPFVATLVDVSGLIIYFSVAQWVMTHFGSWGTSALP